MKTLLSKSLLGMLLLASLLVFSCRGSRKAKPMKNDISSYIYAYTSGTISKKAPIRVRFTNAVIERDKIGGDAAKMISFSPSISGTPIWEDDRTILLEPTQPLQSKTLYLASVNLGKIYQNLPSELQSFEFNFQTRELYFEVDENGYRLEDPQDYSKPTLPGTLHFSDVATPEEAEKVLSAFQNGKRLNIKWIHTQDLLRHDFVVDGLMRSDKRQDVTLQWSGSSLGISQKGEKNIYLPPLNTFEVTQSKVLQDKDQCVLLHFSDYLLQNQDIQGLITIDHMNNNLSYTIDGNLVRVFPSGRLSGAHDIHVAPGIKNSNGQSLTNPYQASINFETALPSVRLVGKGVILPNSNGLMFPFEAVSLNAVDVEVFKIFNNNILQFLQTNELDGNYDLYRVGRIVFQKKVSLKELNSKANTKEWVRYSLDLSKLIQADPGAIYQVRIGFKQQYADYECAKKKSETKDNSSDLMNTKNNLENEDEVESIMNYYGYGDSEYDDGERYNWEDRKNPCKSAYYNPDKFISRNVISSNLGIIAKGGEDRSYFVVVADILTTEPVAGAKLEFFDAQNQAMKTAVTDNSGAAMLEFERTPAVVVATKANQKGYLRLTDGSSLSLSKFDISGTETPKGLKGYIYGERGVWRPGDSLFLNFVLSDKSNKLPSDYPVQFELSDAKGQLIYKITSTTNVHNVYPFKISTRENAPTGTWLAKVKVGGATFTQPLKIETVKPNRLKLALDFGKTELHSDETNAANLQVNWLHGAPASNLKTKVDVAFQSVKTAFPKYPNFAFDDPARSQVITEPKVLFDGNLDENGFAKVYFQGDKNVIVPGKMKLNFTTRVFEKGGDFSTDNFSIAYHPYPAYVGIEIPKTKYNENRIDIDKKTDLKIVVVDPSGNPLANRSVKVGLYRCDWRWWWENGDDNISKFNNSNHLGSIEQRVVQTNSKGEAVYSVKVNDWGRYLIRACDESGGHCGGNFFYAGYPWYGEGEGMQEGASMLSFSVGKENYKVGDAIELKIPTAQRGKVLITLESGSRVVDYYWKDASSGENTFRITAKPEYAPTVYAYVTFLQPHAQTNNDLPIRMYGVAAIGVEDPATKLQPEVVVPKEIKPDQNFSVEVKEKSNRGMAYTLAIVDEGLLDLTRFQTPNPWNAFFAREALGVRTWDVYDYVLGAYGGELERILSIGGDGINHKAASERKANRFKPVVQHLGPFYLERGKTAKHNLRINNYIGSVRVMVVASDKTAFGSTEATVPVKNPLMLLATLPRTLSPGDKISVPVNIFAMDKKVKDVSIQIKETGGMVNFSNATSAVNFDKLGDKIVNFDAIVNDKQGIANFTITAQGGGESATQQIEVQVRNPNAYTTNIIDGVVEVGKSWSSPYPEFGMPGTQSAVLEVSSLPSINLTSRLKYLIQYPHGCIEQTTSAAFPQLFVEKLTKLDDTQKKDVAKNVQAALDKLRSYQTDAGGFGYWPGDPTPNHWASNYAGHFIIEAKNKGYTIPANLLERWLRFQQKVAQRWDPLLDDGGGYDTWSKELNQAYRLYTLALAKSPEYGAMNRLRERKNLNIAARWRLAGAYAATGKTEVARELIKTPASTQKVSYDDPGFTYGSELRDDAMVLETLALLGDKQNGFEQLKKVAAQLGSQEWYSTQSTGYSLLAIGKFIGTVGYNSECKFSYQVGNGSVTNATSAGQIFQIPIPNDGKKVSLKNLGSGVLFSRIVTTGQPKVGDVSSSKKNLEIAVSFKSLKGETLNPESIVQGTDFIAEVTVRNPGTKGIDYREMALTQIFPSGWEIRNTRMENRSSNQGFNYQDIRDDRVNTYFYLPRNQSKTFTIQLNAAYLGKYYMPSVLCEAMYNNSIYARQGGRWVTIFSGIKKEI